MKESSKKLAKKQWDLITSMELSSSQYDLLTEVLQLERQIMGDELINN